MEMDLVKRDLDMLNGRKMYDNRNLYQKALLIYDKLQIDVLNKIVYLI